MNRRIMCYISLLLGIVFLVANSTTALSAEFYKDKTLKLK